MCVFSLEMNSTIDTIKLQRGFCMKFTTHLRSLSEKCLAILSKQWTGCVDPVRDALG